MTNRLSYSIYVPWWVVLVSLPFKLAFWLVYCTIIVLFYILAGVIFLGVTFIYSIIAFIKFLKFKYSKDLKRR